MARDSFSRVLHLFYSIFYSIYSSIYSTRLDYSTGALTYQQTDMANPSLLDAPVLTLALDNLSRLNSIDEKELSAIWNLFTKVKDNLENGRRLENISWRLWFRSTHPPQQQLPDLLAPSPRASLPMATLLDSSLSEDDHAVASPVASTMTGLGKKKKVSVLSDFMPLSPHLLPFRPASLPSATLLTESGIQEEESQILENNASVAMALPRSNNTIDKGLSEMVSSCSLSRLPTATATTTVATRPTFFLSSSSTTTAAGDEEEDSFSEETLGQHQQHTLGRTLSDQRRRNIGQTVRDSLDMQRAPIRPVTLLSSDESHLSYDEEEEDSLSETMDSSCCENDDSEDDSSCYGASWSYTPSPLFQKVTLFSNQPESATATDPPAQVQSQLPFVPPSFGRPGVLLPSHRGFSSSSMVSSNSSSKKCSLLSAAISQKKRCSTSMQQHHTDVDEYEYDSYTQGGTSTLSSSVRQTLLTDRSMPFNTTLCEASTSVPHHHHATTNTTSTNTRKRKESSLAGLYAMATDDWRDADEYW